MRTDENLKPYSCEFLDAVMEERYRLSTQSQAVQLVRISMLVVATLFLVFGLVDYTMVGLTRNFYILIAMRSVVAVACLLPVAALGRDPARVNNPLPLNLACFLLVTSLIFIVPLRPETLNTQLTGVVAGSIAIYLFIPNRIPWMIALNVYLALGFLVSVILWGSLPGSTTAAIALVLVLPNVIGLITARRLSRLQRLQFAALLAEREANIQLQNQIKERQRLEEELRHQARIDDLTGLNNRRWFLELAEQELRHTRRQHTPLALCMVDLDHFKAINDRKGHAAGDRVLTLVASACREVLRDSDIIGRFGGEEFVIALPGASPMAALEIAERLRNRIDNFRFPPEFEELHLTVTVGMTQVKPEEANLEPALLRADQALYLGKHQGRNTVVVAENSAIA